MLYGESMTRSYPAVGIVINRDGVDVIITSHSALVYNDIVQRARDYAKAKGLQCFRLVNRDGSVCLRKPCDGQKYGS